ncbi:MAG: DNA gyrase inhibitor YacG [Gammaproteobacteria bacterium]
MSGNCPRCGRQSPDGTHNPDRPFCSRQCRLADFGAWIGGEHAIAGEPVELPDDFIPGETDADCARRH